MTMTMMSEQKASKAVKCFICGETFHNDSIQTFIEINREDYETAYVCKRCVADMAVKAGVGSMQGGQFSFFDPELAAEAEYSNAKDIKVPKYQESTPSKIKAFLDEHVIGQEAAKRAISVAYYSHLKRISGRNNIKKSNILVSGPTGSGKTLLAEKLAEFAKVPLVIEDATRFTKKGYVGEDVETMVEDLFQKSGYNKTSTENGIIYIDECDKLANQDTTSLDVGGRSVQNALLKLMEGVDVNVDGYTINTKNILFICGGAFSGIEELAKKNRTKSIGFGSSESDFSQESSLQPEDFIAYGLTPEFVGRLPVIVTLNGLTEEDLIRVITEPKQSLFREYVELFKMDGVDFDIDQKALKMIANKALRKKSGARGLRGILNTELAETMFLIPDTNPAKILLTINPRTKNFSIKAGGG